MIVKDNLWSSHAHSIPPKKPESQDTKFTEPQSAGKRSATSPLDDGISHLGRLDLKKLWIGIAFALVLAACGGGDDGATTQPPAEDEAMADEAMTDEEMSDEAMSDEEMSDEAMSDEEMSDESMTDEEMSDESMTDEGHSPTSFTVTITNVSDTAELETPLAPGAFAVHSAMDTLFVAGELDRGQGLEALAEDGDPSVLVAALEAESTVSSAGAFAIPDGAEEAGPALPGSGYSFTFEATPGEYLSFATMFVQSNDWFFAPSSSGIALFDGADPISGEITDLVSLWDAGTEVDETPGEGANQAPRQAGPDTGDAQDAPIAAVDGFAGTITVSIAVSG